MSKIDVSASESVAGYSVYGATVRVRGGADFSTVLTANAGKIAAPD